MLRLFGLFTTSLVLFSYLTAQDRLKAYQDTDAYEVYSAIFPEEWPIKEAHAKSLVIRSETVGYKMCLEPDKEFESLVGTAMTDYVKQNKNPWLLQQKFGADTPYKLVTPADLRAVYDKGSWDDFYKKYPDSGGVVEMSAVGFNGNKTIAIAYLGHSCGMRCGGGEFHVLQKKDGKWVPIEWRGISCNWQS